MAQSKEVTGSVKELAAVAIKCFAPENIETAMAPLLGKLLTDIRNMLDEKVEKHGEGVEGRVMPEGLDELVESIDGFLGGEAYDQAFTVALGHPDLILLLVKPETLFIMNDAGLTQPVILSLIHQLSLELLEKTSLKLEWTQELVMQLDPRSDAIKGHVARVVELVLGRIGDLLGGTAVDAGVARKARTVYMILNGLL